MHDNHFRLQNFQPFDFKDVSTLSNKKFIYLFIYSFNYLFFTCWLFIYYLNKQTNDKGSLYNIVNTRLADSSK